MGKGCTNCKANDHYNCERRRPFIGIPEKQWQFDLLKAIFGEPVTVCCCGEEQISE